MIDNITSEFDKGQEFAITDSGLFSKDAKLRKDGRHWTQNFNDSIDAINTHCTLGVKHSYLSKGNSKINAGCEFKEYPVKHIFLLDVSTRSEN